MENKMKFKSILKVLEKKGDLEELCDNLKWLLVKASQKYSVETVGHFSSPVTMFKSSYRHGDVVITKSLQVPHRISDYLKILDDSTTDPKKRLITLFDVLSSDSKMLHTNIRDRIWDDIQSTLDKPMPEQSGIFARSLNTLFSASIRLPHSIAVGIKDECVGSRDHIDKELRMIYEILTADTADKFIKKYEQCNARFPDVKYSYSLWDPRIERMHRISEISKSL
ncbi:hypothetical protein [Legionella shakespearei]|nr:hypothetical protein [Legionella shakespearei]